MVLIPQPEKLKLEVAIENKMVSQKRRTYLGISSIGKPCARDLWYGFRWCTHKTITARLARLFQRGHNEEPIIVADLKAAGIKVHSDQKECTDGQGHIKGHIDGIGENIPDAPLTLHLLEFKTMNDKNFKKMCKEHCYTAQQGHWAQIQCYMKKFGLKRALYVCVNKNDDSRYYERIKYVAKDAKFYLDRAIDIISSEFPPAKIGNAAWWQCKFCDHYQICHYKEAPDKNCRTCQHGDIHDRGVWRCALTGKRKYKKGQEAGCDKYAILEGLKNGD